MATVLVTGGAGYVGSHACKALAEAGHTPVTYDNLMRGYRSAVKWGPLEIGDILDGARLSQALKKHNPAAVMHFAALALVAESVSDPALYFKNNVEGTRVLLDSMATAGIHRLVFSSTCAIYGTPKIIPILETEAPDPINPYGESKLRVEQMLAARSSENKLSSISLRYFNAAGADPGGEIGEDHDPEPHLIPNVLAAAAGGKRLTVNGDTYPTADGTCVRDYIHVSDIAAAHISALNLLADTPNTETLNLGTGEGYSVMQVINAVERVTGSRVPFDIGLARPGDPPELIADATQAHTRLCWKPVRSDLDTIVSDAWQWMQNRLRNSSSS
jgi:UDP-glucose-4-epimerase GalE